MDTKWKKSKIILSFAAFFLGVTLLIGSVWHLARLIVETDGEVCAPENDYQESAEFRRYISAKLEELVSVVNGGESWKYGVMTEGGYDTQQSWPWDGAYEVSDAIVEEKAEAVAEYLFQEQIQTEEQAADTDWYEGQSLDEYMAGMERNKNLRYAAIRNDRLLYTNIEEFQNEFGKQFRGDAIQESLSADEYNFFLWFNRNRDGKVQIFKDGEKEDIYGNGVYTSDSRWFVPGYTNFSIDEASENVIIFMAAAKEPKLYVEGGYSKNGTVSYGETLYYMRKNFLASKRQFKINCALLAASVLLLVLAFIWRKEKHCAERGISRFLGKIYLEVKLLFFLVCLLPALKRMMLPVCFWLCYLLFLDWRENRGKQRKPIVDGIRTRELKYSLQKRIVRRGRLPIISGGLALLICCLALSGMRNMEEWYFQDKYIGVLLFIAVILLLNVAVGFLYLEKNRHLAEDIGALSDRILEVRNGNLEDFPILPQDAEMKEVFENLSEIRRGMDTALRERMSSEQMKVDLVANVSHDIKTPLTSIISYIELLKQEEGLPEHVKEFIQILGEKSERLRTIVQDVFEISKATSGQLPVTMEELDLGKLLQQTLADMAPQIEQSRLIMKVSIPESPIFIQTDGQRLYRVFQNLIQNALKYSLAGSRVYLNVAEEEKQVVVCIKNISGRELERTLDFTERFVRGDVSRTDGGSGLGLSIAKSFTEACGGSLQVEIDADLFTVAVMLPRNCSDR
ncbi:HAMP domain-containing sensor histidine kinase [Lachnospiraceae bacterium 46-15]